MRPQTLFTFFKKTPEPPTPLAEIAFPSEVRVERAPQEVHPEESHEYIDRPVKRAVLKDGSSIGKLSIKQNVEEKEIKSLKRNARSTYIDWNQFDVLEGLGIENLGNNQSSHDLYAQFDDATPEWAREGKRRDRECRKEDHPEYDPTSLYIPPEEYKGLTLTMQQYWKTKSEFFDHILFFKLGKFYEVFFDDALLCNRILGINFTGKKLHAGVPESSLDKYLKKLVDGGYKIAIVDQVEDGHSLKERMITDKKAKRKSEKIVKRELSRLHSKGTTPISDLEDTCSQRYLWVFQCEKEGSYALVLTEISLGITLLIYDPDDKSAISFRHWLTQTPPAEVVYDPLGLPDIYLEAFKKLPEKPVLTPIQKGNISKIWNPLIGMELLKEELQSTGNLQLYKNIEEMINDTPTESREHLQVAFGCLINYLNKLMILKQYVQSTNISKADESTSYGRMRLDGFVLDHLELISSNSTEKKSNSLMDLLDSCTSAPGRRLLKSWICSPSTNSEEIDSRLDAIEELNANREEVQSIKSALRDFKDYERKLTRLTTYALKQSSSVMYGDISSNRIIELRNFITKCIDIRELLTEIRSEINPKKQSRLHKLLIPSLEDGLLPEIREIGDSILQKITWVDSDNTPMPKEGLQIKFDEARREMQKSAAELSVYLNNLKDELNTNDIEYTHTKNRYEIQISAKFSKIKGTIPKDFEISSEKKGYIRYTSDFTRDRVERIELQERKMKSELAEFSTLLFQELSSQKYTFQRFLQVIKELDVLCALMDVSFDRTIKMTRPIITKRDPEADPFFRSVALVHPVISSLVPNFVPNNVNIGCEFNGSILLITGPNMGGKSTMLRQVAIAIIMGQIGCYVSAKECSFTLVDRIFSRLGATDKIIIGKSTFQVEAEEALQLLKYGTIDSLALIDELGRGTSHLEAVAYASSYVEEIESKIGCRTMFATHYIELLAGFIDQPKVSFYHMEVEVDHSDVEEGKITFTYNFGKGIAKKSYALEVAKLAGIPNEIIDAANKVIIPNSMQISPTVEEEVYRRFNKMLEELGMLENTIQ